jgi:hypothetical protein
LFLSWSLYLSFFLVRFSLSTSHFLSSCVLSSCLLLFSLPVFPP